MARVRKRSVLPEVSAGTALLAYRLAYLGLILGTMFVPGADARAAEANECCGTLEVEAPVIGGRAAKLEKEAAEIERLEGELIARFQLKDRLAALHEHQKPRQLSDAQKSAIIASISPFRGQKVTITSIAGDPDGKQYAEDFAALFRAAEWDHGGDAGVSYDVYDVEPVGIQVTLNENLKKPVPAIEALLCALQKLGLIGTGRFVRPEIPPGEVQVRIGRKPAWVPK